MHQRTFWTYLVILILLGSMLFQAATAQERAAREYQVKAAMLLNVAKFVDWPNEKAGTTKLQDLRHRQEPFRHCT